MKKLRMTLATSMLLFLTAIVLQSCLDDWDDKYDTLFAVGTVKVIEGKDYYSHWTKAVNYIPVTQPMFTTMP